MNAATENASSAMECSVDVLRSECEQSWNKVKETLQEIERHQQTATSVGPSATPVSQQWQVVSILKNKERRLRAEIEIMKERAPQTLPNNPKIIEASLLESLEKEVVQLKETVSLVEAQRQELQASIQQEQEFKQQLIAVGQKLQEKCDGLEQPNEPADAVEVVAQELEGKINTARHTERTVMRKMAEFVGKHFPVPEPEQVAKVYKETRSRKQQTNTEMLPLKDILRELMTKCVENPEDPYLMLNDRHWPAYVELLLRCNIILHHPEDDRRVKLVPFHL